MKDAHYLLLLELPWCRDGDEWLGIYHDDGTLRRAYETAVAQWASAGPEGSHLQVAIYRFDPAPGEPYTSYGVGLDRQTLRKVEPRELACFQEAPQG